MIQHINLPPADGVDFNGGNVDYYVMSDPVHWETDNRPLKNLAYRDNVSDAKLNEVIDALNAMPGPLSYKPTPQATPDNTVLIEAGRHTDSTGENVVIRDTAFNSPAFQPVTSGHERYDLLSIDDSGNPQITQGIEIGAGSGDPVINAPTIQSNMLAIAVVKVDETSTVVVDSSDITDIREFLNKGRGIDLYDEGVLQGTATRLDFIGAGVTASVSGGIASITIPGGGGGTGSCGDEKKFVDYFTATAGQTLFNLSDTYVIGSHDLSVYRNGKKLSVGTEYTETSTSSITLVNAAIAGDIIHIIVTKAAPGLREIFTMSAGQTIINLAGSYTVGGNSVKVYRNGKKLVTGTEYTETNASTITLANAAISGDVVEIIEPAHTALYSKIVATAGQTLFSLPSTYNNGTNSLEVYRNGKLLSVSTEYVETDNTHVTLVNAALSGDVFEFIEDGTARTDCGGGSIEVKDEGTSVVAGISSLNFVGAGVTATDAGGGQVDVTIPGGGGAGGCGVLDSERQVATANQTVFTLTTITYDPAYKLIVALNGQVLNENDYTKTSSTVVTLASGAQSGDILEFYVIKCVSTQDMIAWHLFNSLTIGQTVLNLPFSYTPGTHHLFVIRNGAELIVNEPGASGFSETSTTSVTLNTPVSSTSERIVVYKISAISGTLNHDMDFHNDAAEILAPGQTYRDLEIDCSSASQVVIKSGTKVLADNWTKAISFTSDVTVDITVSGLNGLDTGSEAANTWYYVWAIKDPVAGTVAGLLSTSATAPTLPTGYTLKRLIGAVRNDSSSNFEQFLQNNNRVTYVDNKLIAALTNNSSWATYNLSSYIPDNVNVINYNVDCLAQPSTTFQIKVSYLALSTGSYVLNVSSNDYAWDMSSTSMTIHSDKLISITSIGSNGHGSVRVEGYTLNL